jgi:hypothetical protein
MPICPYAVPMLGEVYDTLGQRYKCLCYPDARCGGSFELGPWGDTHCVYYRAAFLPFGKTIPTLYNLGPSRPTFIQQGEWML